MLNSRWIAVLALFSFSALAQVSMEEKRERVELLGSLSSDVPVLGIESYHRELNYEENRVPLEDRAQIETNLLAEKIRLQVRLAYEEAIEKNENPDEAFAEVKANIERDLQVAHPQMKDELQRLALEALDMVKAGGLSSAVTLQNVESIMRESSLDRSQFLNQEVPRVIEAGPQFKSRSVPTPDAERLQYKSKRELLSALVSDRDNALWLGGASFTINSGVSRRADAKISYQLKISFLGATIEGGPTIAFKREYSSTANIQAEGLNAPFVNGNFDFLKRDSMGRIVQENGRNARRFISFTCDNSLAFETDYSGAGGFSMAGMGASASVGSKFSQSVKAESRRVLVPEYIDNRSVSMNTLANLCQNDFMNTMINSHMTVKQSLNYTMRQVVSNLQFSHARTRCATDVHCRGWFVREMQGLIRTTAYPRCIEETREHYRSCVVKSLRNQKCPVYKDGKLVSSGMFEYTCDNGLRCETVRENSWFQTAEGRCTPRNAATYQAPRF